MRIWKNLCTWIVASIIAVGGLAPAMAQSGPDNMIALRLNAMDGKMIQLISSDGKTFSFKIDTHTIYCKGEKKVADWGYLKEKIGKEDIVTLKLSKDNKKALVVWDQGPSMVSSLSSQTSGSMSFGFPPMCK